MIPKLSPESLKPIPTVLTIICCVCRKFLGYKDGEGISGISHSYCQECLETEMKKLKEQGLIK